MAGSTQTSFARSPAARAAFTRAERASRHLAGVDDRTWMTAAWCAKEPFGKALGTGLEGRPSRFETRVAGPGLLAVEDRVVRWIQLDTAMACSADGHSLIVGWTLVPHDLIDLGQEGAARDRRVRLPHLSVQGALS